MKIHLAVNIKTKKILSIKVTAMSERAHDGKALPEVVENIIKSDGMTTTTAMGKLFADGAYEGNEIFRYLSDNGILSCIKVRKTAQVQLKKRTYSKKSISYILEKGFAKLEVQRKLWAKMDCC